MEHRRLGKELQHGEPCVYYDDDGVRHRAVFVAMTFEGDGFAWIVLTDKKAKKVAIVPARDLQMMPDDKRRRWSRDGEYHSLWAQVWARLALEVCELAEEVGRMAPGSLPGSWVAEWGFFYSKDVVDE